MASTRELAGCRARGPEVPRTAKLVVLTYYNWRESVVLKCYNWRAAEDEALKRQMVLLKYYN